jgi:hypothetical protein
VIAYDAGRGLGSLEAISSEGEGLSTYRFHSTAIADGSRHIDAGTPVVFALAAGLGGVVEARFVSPVAGGLSPTWLR